MSTRPPTDLWDWRHALVAARVSDGAWATGDAWATHRWRWARGLTEDDVVASEGGMTLEDFRRRYRPSRAVSSLRRDFTELMTAGLLERVRRGSWAGGNVYVPRVPDRARRMLPAGEEQEHTAHQRAQYSAHITADRAQYSAQERGALRSTSPVAPSSPRTPEPPSRARAPAPAREGAQGGGGTSSARQDNPAAAAALSEVLGAMRPEDSRKVAPGHAGQCTAVLSDLLAAGWRPYQVAAEVTSGSFRGVGSVGAVLLSRMQLLREQPSPAAPRRPAALDPDDPGAEEGLSPTLAAIAQRRASEEEQRRAAVPAPADVRAGLRRLRGDPSTEAVVRGDGDGDGRGDGETKADADRPRRHPQEVGA